MHCHIPFDIRTLIVNSYYFFIIIDINFIDVFIN